MLLFFKSGGIISNSCLECFVGKPVGKCHTNYVYIERDLKIKINT